jgi:hypothetical protein
MKTTYEWKIHQLPEPDDLGRLLCIVLEQIRGGEIDDIIYGPMPCTTTDAFVRIRRTRVAHQMRDAGALSAEEILSPTSTSKD